MEKAGDPLDRVPILFLPAGGIPGGLSEAQERVLGVALPGALVRAGICAFVFGGGVFHCRGQRGIHKPGGGHEIPRAQGEQVLAYGAASISGMVFGAFL